MPRAFGDSLQLSDELGVYPIVSGAERVQRRLSRREQDAEHRIVLFVSGSDPSRTARSEVRNLEGVSLSIQITTTLEGHIDEAGTRSRYNPQKRPG